ncbi:hypothetical protein ACFLVC_04345, partial [Chloroflexota bacterium]
GTWTEGTVHSMNPSITSYGLGGRAINEASMHLRNEYFKEYYEKYHEKTGGPPIAREAEEEVLKPGMTFEFEPSAHLGRHWVNVGGTVIVTETGNEELNKIGTKMRIAGEAW